MKKLLLLFPTLCLLAASCQKDNNFTPLKYSIEAGQTIKLRDGFRITFVEITEDSRCPLYATCIWRGRAIASFLATNDNGETLTFRLTDYERPTIEPKEAADVFGHTIRLLGVTPWPDSVAIDPGDYEVEIKVD